MVVKRVFDLALSLFGLILAAPVLVVLAIAIRLSSPGPALYRGLRIGRYGTPFRMFKFRTMVVNAEQLGNSCTADDDVRITPIGRRLRKLKLDELPQLLNVLNGTMSFVGPRPEVEKFVKMFTDEERQILTVKPGITDWASLWNPDEGAVLNGVADPEKVYLKRIRPEKLRLQLEYVQHRSFWIDLRILWSTAELALRRTFTRTAVPDTDQNTLLETHSSKTQKN